MSSQNCRLRELLVDAFGDRNVGEQHELFDEQIGFEQLLDLDVDRTRLLRGLEMDLDFGGREVEGTGGHTLRAQLDRDRVEEADPLGQRIGERRVVFASLCGLVGEGFLRRND